MHGEQAKQRGRDVLDARADFESIGKPFDEPDALAERLAERFAERFADGQPVEVPVVGPGGRPLIGPFTQCALNTRV